MQASLNEPFRRRSIFWSKTARCSAESLVTQRTLRCAKRTPKRRGGIREFGLERFPLESSSLGQRARKRLKRRYAWQEEGTQSSWWQSRRKERQYRGTDAAIMPISPVTDAHDICSWGCAGVFETAPTLVVVEWFPSSTSWLISGKFMVRSMKTLRCSNIRLSRKQIRKADARCFGRKLPVCSMTTSASGRHILRRGSIWSSEFAMNSIRRVCRRTI